MADDSMLEERPISLGRRELFRAIGGAVAGVIGNASTPVAAQSGADEETWSQFSHDDHNTGHAPKNSGPTESVAEQWRFETDWPVWSSPAIVDGTVYVGSDYMYALDATTGEEQWRLETRDVVLSSPAVVDGTVYIGSRDDNVYALDAERATNSGVSKPATRSGRRQR